MTATVSSDGPWQGGIGLAIGYCVATGELAVDDIADEDRAFFAEQFLITADNVADFATPKIDRVRLRVRQRLQPCRRARSRDHDIPRRGRRGRHGAPPASAGGVLPGRRSRRSPWSSIFVVFSVLSSEFRTLGNVQNIMDTAAVLAVVTCGITFVLMMGSIDLSAPGVMGASAIAVSLLVANNRNDNDLGLLGVLVAVLLAAALGLPERAGAGAAEGPVVHDHPRGLGHRPRHRDPPVRRRAAQHLRRDAGELGGRPAARLLLPHLDRRRLRARRLADPALHPARPLRLRDRRRRGGARAVGRPGGAVQGRRLHPRRRLLRARRASW